MSTDEHSLVLTPTGDERLIIIDEEHFSVRLLVPVLVIGATLLVHVAGRAILDRLLPTGVNTLCVILPIDLLTLFAVGYGIEAGLKRLFPSRRCATLSEQALTIHDGRVNPPEITRLDWNSTVNVLAWYFPIRRRTRVPKGWHCMSIHLLQDQDEVILYAFMSPQDAQHVPGHKNFVRLRPRKETESATDLHTAAGQRRLLKLEGARWADGAEIAADDFIAVLNVLSQVVPGWQ
jgi:hypothetical protein